MGAPKKASTKRASKTKEAAPAVVLSYKGFDSNWQCRGFQYEIGKTYSHEGEVEACASGFHACEYPLHVLRYYRPGTSRFAVVEQSGALARHKDDTKIASSQITVKAEIDIAGLIKAATASGDYGAATASGDSGAATASGDYGKVRGAAGCALFLTERDSARKIVAVWAGIAGQDGIKPDVFYTLRNGKPVEAA